MKMLTEPLLKIFPRSESCFPVALLHGAMMKSLEPPRRPHTFAAIVSYDGVWLDVGFLLFRDLDNLC